MLFVEREDGKALAVGHNGQQRGVALQFERALAHESGVMPASLIVNKIPMLHLSGLVARANHKQRMPRYGAFERGIQRGCAERLSQQRVGRQFGAAEAKWRLV